MKTFFNDILIVYNKLTNYFYNIKSKQTKMNTSITVNGVSIELTKDQLEQIDIQRKLIDRKSKPVIERIKTYEDACEELGIEPNQSLPYPDPQNSRQEYINASHKLDIIAEVLREGKELDWNNSNQYKYYPWFYLDKPGFRFADSFFFYSDTWSCGARLCVDTREKSDFFGKQFLSIWKTYNGQ